MIFKRIEDVVLENVSKRYGNFFAVRELNLTVEGGELLALIGPSGSGKTTTLRMINRLVEPDEGRVLINGQDISEIDAVRLRRNIGYVIQQIGLFPHMKVWENIGLIPKLEGWEEEKIRQRVDELLKLVDLPIEFAERYPWQLSGGQQQRVGLARALALNPPLLLMDEPFGALDPILRKQLQEEFARIKEELGKTIVFVTHDVEEAFRLGDRIAIMNEGRLVQVGEPEELIINPANEFVEDITGARRKFRHLDTLKVKDFMISAEKYLIQNMEVAEALKEFRKRGVEVGFLDSGRAVFLKDIAGREGKISEYAREVKSFAPSDSLVSALLELRESGEFVGVVEEKGEVVGVLLSNEILMRLI
ncbi:betaine/proline/choline family ABC transporter ATP-binding protein [Archaeoglobus sp.]|uniref:betaine/proline/choline family ABC transporter ATP-binding protein n=1 Tax=Archaeoglobus sp. TaxID=1872626 RepID=UPI0024AB96C7|nr:betaine/proline/choline family ABC transporter ATP-binding protein [Archaeoglobus sp.]MDI3497962.1 osmoprotectant transport system ATP-binding protein [Archaeoglobus sp.]